MADIRTTITGTTGKYISRVPGTRIGVQVNTFAIERLKGISGKDLAPIMMQAMSVAYNQATDDWPVLTGASKDSIELKVTEEGPKHARVALMAGGQKLIKDTRNKSRRDYAPFIEFLGTPTSFPGILTNSVIGNDAEIKQAIKDGLAELIDRKLRG